MHASKNPVVPPKARHSVFTQSWIPAVEKLPHKIQKMLKAAKRYGVRLDALAYATQIKNELPIWFHIGADPKLSRLNNYYYSKCLRDQHGILTVGQMVDFTELSHPDHVVDASIVCACPMCINEQAEIRCLDPRKCRVTAEGAVEDLTEEVIEANKVALRKGGTLIFNPAVTVQKLSDGYRALGKAQRTNDCLAVQQLRVTGTEPADRVTVSTGHLVVTIPLADRVVGGSAWFGSHDERNISLRSSENEPSGATGELKALILALQKVPKDTPITINVTEKSILLSLTTDLPRLEDVGWMGCENSGLLKAIVADLHERIARVKLSMLSQRKNPEGARGSPDLARLGAANAVDTAINLQIKEGFALDGIKLVSGTQAVFYRGILACTEVPIRRPTLVNLDIARHAVKDLNGSLPSDEQLWKSIRDKDIPKAIRVFLWKGQQSRAIELIWEKCEDMWRRRIRYGTVLGCNLADFKTVHGRRKTGTCRLFQILVTEAAHLIWKIRCERAIQREDPDDFHTGLEIENRWWAAINKRLKMDKLYTDKARYGKKAVPEKTVLHTWSGVLWNEENLPDNHGSDNQGF
ncbi:hypothetical protein Hypma_009809 [Hypsizygus marmoreus]|uniref:Uncharacterized protein n=1 Tax=Hypsizygus marmoreus TaxID=39966 RepID=A0A369JT64_HYPMA|nr:hypothetical protein Hypma_009809 [Hypsizygus marmoreus]